MKTNRNSIFVLLLGMIFLVIVINCASSLRTYVSARTVLNNYWETYLDYRDAFPDGETKDALRAKFKDTGKTSYFTQAKDALDAWDKVLQTPDQTSQAQIYYAIWNQIMVLMLSENIVVVK